MSSFLEALRSRVLVLDGAMGTELERNGVDTKGQSWTSRAILSHPELIRKVHEEYIRAGADIITTNTFRTNPSSHVDSGLDANALTLRAVELANEARASFPDKEIFIAGSIAPAFDCFTPGLVPTESVLMQEHSLMARWLADAGVDLILIETMSTVREALIALKSVKSVCDLPVAVSLVAWQNGLTLSKMPLDESFRLLAKAGADVLMMNCTPLSVMKESFEALQETANESGVRFGLYPNASEKRADGAWDLTANSDALICAEAERWVSRGAHIVGTCCGTTPATTHGLKTIPTVDNSRA